MRLKTTAALRIVVAAIATGGALVPEAVGAQTSGAPTPVSVPWDVAQVGPGERSLVPVYAVSLNCPVAGAEASASETATAVTVAVKQETFPARQCIDPAQGPYPATAIVTAQLAAPLVGRRIVGMRERLAVKGLGFGRSIPRLTGLAPADALDVTHDWGVQAHFCRVALGVGLPRVVAQRSVSAQQAPGRRNVLRVKIAGRGATAAACNA